MQKRYVEREALEQFLNNWIAVYEGNPEFQSAALAIKSTICQIPNATVREDVKGHWIPPRYPYHWYKAKCSACGYEDEHSSGDPETRATYHAPDFCPGCGADLRDDNHVE